MDSYATNIRIYFQIINYEIMILILNIMLA